MSPLDRLTHELAKLPGIGQRTAFRLAMYILRQEGEYARSLSHALLEVAERVSFCSRCFHFTHEDPCSICTDGRREPHLLCVVEDSSDLMAIERTHGYRGYYHVLQGALSPLDGVGPEQLRVRELLARLHQDQIREVILATNPNVTGDATALYLSKTIKPLGIKVTRLAAGIPVGGTIEYIDQMTLSKAMESRRDY